MLMGEMCTVDGSQGSQMMCLLEISSVTQQFSLKLFARNEGMCPQGVVWPFWSRQEQCQVLPLLTQTAQAAASGASSSPL